MDAKTPRFPGLLGRLRFYLFGLAIGLMLLTFFQMAKGREAAARQAEAERIRNQPQPGGLFPELPAAEKVPAAR